VYLLLNVLKLFLYIAVFHLTYNSFTVIGKFYFALIALGYGLDDRGSRVRFPAGAENFSLQHRVQNGSGTHPASYPVGTKESFPGGKAAG
jgi:glutamine synthetase